MSTESLRNAEAKAMSMQSLVQMDAAAENAMTAADCAEMYAVYKRIRAANETIISATETLLGHYIEKSDKQPRYQEDSTCVASMKEVALAAIGLARAVLKEKE